MRKFMNIVVMTLAGLFLIVAAGLKFHQMLNECIPSWQDNPTGFWESYEFFLIQIPLEFALGVWMVSGLFRKAAWLAGTLAYFAFIFVTLGKVMTGAESCGCFGQIHVDPMITLLAIDVPFFVLLAIFWPKGGKLLPPPWPNLFYIAVVAAPVVAVMVLAPSMLVTFKYPCVKQSDVKVDPSAELKLQIHQLNQQIAELKARPVETVVAPSTDKEFVSGALKVTVSDKPGMYTVQLGQQVLVINASDLEKILISVGATDKQKMTLVEEEQVQISLVQEATPEVIENGETTPAVDDPPIEPVANQWDWLQYVVEDDVREAISEGLVIVMMHRHDCIVCEEAAPKYSAYYGQMVADGNDEFKIAFLEIPDYGDESHVPADTQCPSGRLTDQEKFEIMSPYVVALLDGQLVKEWPRGTAPEPDKLLDEVFGE